MGRLTWAAIPFDQPVVMIASGTVGFVIFCVLALVTVKGWWPYLWREWITSVDHKRIGVMYIVLALLMLVRGFSDAMLMRSQLALAAGHAQGYLPPEHYDQIFSAHGTIMIFFVAMPFVDRAHELRPAATAWRARCRLSSAQFRRLLADPRRVCSWSTCRSWSASLPAPAGLPIRR